MYKKLLNIFILFSIGILSISSVSAVTIPSPVEGTLWSNVSRVLGLIQPIATLIFLGTFFWGGYNIMTGGDQEDKVKKGYNILIYSTVGMVIIFLGPSAVQLIGTLFGVDLIEF